MPSKLLQPPLAKMWIGSPTPAAGRVTAPGNTRRCAARGSLLACVVWLLALEASVRVAVVDGAERPQLAAVADPPAASPRDSGYRGVWYANQPSGDEYRYKYSGGFATYPHQTVPCALYDATVNRTFFCYSGAVPDGKSLVHLVGEFDHATGRVARPVILLDKQTPDAHDNPTLMLDDAGHVWVFSAAHGQARPAFIHRSTTPHSIDHFERIAETSFSYAHPWWIPGRGFLFAQTHYLKGRQLAIQTSPDGRDWSKPRPFALMEQGSYQVTWRRGTRLATVFDVHPEPIGLNARANIYFAQTADFGQTWQTILGDTLALPLTNAQNPALVYDSRADHKLVYLKDLNFDAQGRPIILYLLSDGYHSGPRHGLRTWYTLRWTGDAWDRREFTTSDHNYDHGSLYVEEGGRWQVVAPTDPGPQPWTTGGEMVQWQSDNQGATWQRVRNLTMGSSRNHTYARRPVDAHPQFYALWADGNTLEPSESALYFTTRDGEAVYRLPREMTGDWAEPERLNLP